ncbi:hypothetical protein HYS47_03150 [Candidatus Woesearchaeota archaeon]|nr:hypothetical protein [Candidatus Woesearchaeota archaeon]
MKLYVIKLCHYPRSTFSSIDFDKLRFYIRKTLKYGTFVKMKYKEAYHFAYHSSFSSGFSVYVLIGWQENQLHKENINAVILENENIDEKRGHPV